MERKEFLALLDAHGTSVTAMLRRLCRNSHDAEDVFQETAIRVWRSFSDRPRLRNPRSWLMTIAYRTFVDHYRTHKAQQESLSETPDNRTEQPEAVAEQAEENGRVNAAIAELSQPIREVVVMHYTAGLTLRQTAEAMGISQGTVKSRLNAGLKKLRSALK